MIGTMYLVRPWHVTGPWFTCEMGRLRDFEEWAGPWRADVRESAPIPQEQGKPDLTRRHM